MKQVKVPALTELPFYEGEKTKPNQQYNKRSEGKRHRIQWKGRRQHQRKEGGGDRHVGSIKDKDDEQNFNTVTENGKQDIQHSGNNDNYNPRKTQYLYKRCHKQIPLTGR